MRADNQAKIRDTIRDFLLTSIPVVDLKDGDNLFESGIVNSLFAIQLMTFVEKTFGIEVGPDDLDMANFESLNATAAFIARQTIQSGEVEV